ncbi:MAG: hypothetical protein DWQ11_06355 [Proteobacteria bacterium]|nr:MAG: hypothetical protein DWQ11_06355 [Pseudomonadota bacterium]
MGRVPLMCVLLGAVMLGGCEPEQVTEPEPVSDERPDPTLRDAGVAAREALEKAGEALRKLGGAASNAAEDALPEPPAVVQPAAPVEERSPEPIDEASEDAAPELRDSGAATAEAAARFLEATRKAAAKVKEAGKDVVEAIREDRPADAPADPAR